MKDIIIKGAREHNLKNINLVLPRDKFIVITGLSGSGKSTLAFDTIYAEGQRRYVESLSAYARQFLGLMNKPDLDSIDGLSPAISIEQKTTSKNPRSTVGTVTEIYDYLRLLFARIGTQYCYNCGKKIKAQTAEAISDLLMKNKGKKIQVLSPIIRQSKGTYEQLIKDLKKEGFLRVRINKNIQSVDDPLKLERYKKHDIDVVIDRFQIDEKARLHESVENAIKKSPEGFVIILYEDGKEELYSSKAACSDCQLNFDELQPRMFSFNSPFGACPDCTGLGFKQNFDEELLIPDRDKSIMDGAFAIFGNMTDGWRKHQLSSVAKHIELDPLSPIKKATKKQIETLLYGTQENVKFKYPSSDWNNSQPWEGVVPMLKRLYSSTESESRKENMEKFMRNDACHKCEGKRLKNEVLSVKINNHSIIDVTDMSIKKSIEFFENLELSEKEMYIAKQVLKEIKDRLRFLKNVGLTYLNLSRNAETLSGGEAQRIRLATQIGSNLMGVLYILDEPSIGLHQRDNDRLIKTLHTLRDLGNTLIVVEHDEDTIWAADHVIDIGPGAGVHGGYVVAEGTPSEVAKNQKSLTGEYLARKKVIPTPKTRRKPDSKITITGAQENNLKNIIVEIPTNVMVSVTGVSGSGKSTLVNEVLYKGLMKKLNNSKELPGKHKEIILGKEVDKVIVIDQDPIGRTPRSNPATYTKLFDEIRALFAMTKEAKMRGYDQGRFSFNVKGGRCENCQGDGMIKIEMNFLPDVYVECEECKGRRYNSQTLEVKYREKNISQVLHMTVEEALSFFENLPGLRRKLETLNDVGLGYIKLGQPATTLSGGEAQRIKLSRELSKRDLGHTLYILDEPTTGLHFEDVNKLLSVLNRLVEKKNTLVIIEHNLDVIKTSDWIIDLGPEGGDEGGEIVAQGTPEEVAKNEKSYTGKYLKKVLDL